MFSIRRQFNNIGILFVAKFVKMGFTAIVYKPVANVYTLHAIKLMGIVQWVVKPAIGENYVTMVMYSHSNISKILSMTCDVCLIWEITIKKNRQGSV